MSIQNKAASINEVGRENGISHMLGLDIWYCTRLPFKRWQQQFSDGNWGYGDFRPVYPVPVKLKYVGQTFLNEAALFKNELPETEGRIYKDQPYREYYLVWNEDEITINLIKEHRPNKVCWLTESYHMCEYMAGQALCVENPESLNPKNRVEATTISSIFLGEGRPYDVRWFTDLMKEEFLELYGWPAHRTELDDKLEQL